MSQPYHSIHQKEKAVNTVAKKVKVHATREKQMVLAFSDKQGLIYTNTMSRGHTVNAKYIEKVLTLFMRSLWLKCPELTQDQWYLH